MSENSPTILILVRDMMFATRVEETARALGYRVEAFAPEGDIVARMVALQPALFIVDMGDAGSEWAAHIARAKSSPATRRVPILAYGPHVDTGAFERARLAGVDEAVARGALAKGMVELIQKHARVQSAEEREALALRCAERLPEEAVRGLEEFNRGEYYECHETLEHVWMGMQDPSRDLYRVVLQVAVAYYQVQRGNWEGALKMFARSKQWFARLPERCRGVDLAQLRVDAERVEEEVRAVVRGEREGVGELGVVVWE